MKPKTRRLLRVAAGVLAVGALVTVGIWWQTRSPIESIRSKIASAFRRPLAVVEENIPIAPRREVGVVLVTREGRSFRFGQVEVTTTTTAKQPIDFSLGGGARAALLQDVLHVGSAQAEGDLRVKLKSDDLVVEEIDDVKQLDEKLLALSDAAELNGQEPRVITRVYRGTFTLTVERKGTVGANWVKVVQEATSSGASISTDDALVFRSEAPVVFAYESMNLKFTSKTAGAGAPDVVERSPRLILVEPDGGVAARTPRSRVTFALVGIDTIRAKQADHGFGFLRMVGPSLDLVERQLATLGAKPLTGEHRLVNPSRVELQRLLERLGHVRARGDAVILYVVGHAVSGNGGQSFVILPEFEGRIEDVLKPDLLMGEGRETAERVVGGNLRDLLTTVTAVAAEADAPAGLLSIREVSDALGTQAPDTAPFALLVDSCFAHSELESLRDRLGLTRSGDYFLLSGDGAFAARTFRDRLDDFFTAPYLRSTNVVLFAAAPGTVALERAHPLSVFGGPVGPIASRLATTSGATWGELFLQMRDVGPTGEQRQAGLTTFSDLSAFKRLEW